ncbi:MAG: alpha/beta fold hydrolase [Acidimicrobiia bacterium]|nr:alpha/beta fold hydrolase [Acidimicrobiia bacterium]
MVLGCHLISRSVVADPSSPQGRGTDVPASTAAPASRVAPPLPHDPAPPGLGPASQLVSLPLHLLERGSSLAGQLVDVAAGTSGIDPARDRRFSHAAWAANPLYRRTAQAYLAWAEKAYGLVDDLGLDTADHLRARFGAALAVEAAAPTNVFAGNPEAIEATLRTGGQSLIDGYHNFLGDAQRNGGMPSMVDTTPFTVGETVAVTPGAVVFRNDVLELIQYRPTTPEVFERPLFFVPPQINKYYVLDLAPGRSLVEHALARGQQVFMVSWRNPSPAEGHWDLATYVTALSEATDAALAVTDSADLNLCGTCAGGITSAALLGHLSAAGDERVNAVTFLVTVLDWSVPSTVGAMATGPGAAAAMAAAQRRGILAGEDLSRLFAWLRPNDLVWNYWVNNYLLGRAPAAFDVLAWNVDSTNLPAGLHADFMAISEGNLMSQAGGLELLGTKVDLGAVTCDAYVVGGATDHITPWKACYETARLLGGDSRFVLGSQGHVQVLVCPPDNPKARFSSNDELPADPDAWLAGATEQVGSWWEDWADWLAPRAGSLVPAPEGLGGKDPPALEAAPGPYVRR